MSFQLKVSGKKMEWTEIEGSNPWTFESRPGGWVIGVNAETGERKRFFYSRKQKQVWAKIRSNENGSDFYGERLEKSAAGDGDSSAADFTAQFPGKVRKVMVQAGQGVQKGDALVMVEAMKMEFAIKAPSAGVVIEICVSVDQQLSPGQEILKFEATQSE